MCVCVCGGGVGGVCVCVGMNVHTQYVLASVHSLLCFKWCVEVAHGGSGWQCRKSKLGKLSHSSED